jgi:transcriptional regulator with XRE-family HTH domain
VEAVLVQFRSLLCDELARRRGANSRYSLRSFARALRIDHSTLSQILRGRRPLTRASMRRLARRLRIEGPVMHRRIEPVLYALAAQGALPANSRAAARLLGTNIDAINIALQRLIRTGVLVMSARNRWEVIT